MKALRFFCVPDEYQGKPFEDGQHRTGPQVIPGRVQAALYDLGGEGIAYHDLDPANHGSGELNHQPEHCEKNVPVHVCYFREGEGVDISYVKMLADLNHPNRVAPDWQQLYIGWTEDGSGPITRFGSKVPEPTRSSPCMQTWRRPFSFH